MYVSYSGLLTYSARGARAIAVCALFLWSAVWLLSRSANPSPPVVAAAPQATIESHIPTTIERTTGDANHAPLGRRARLTARANRIVSPLTPRESELLSSASTSK